LKHICFAAGLCCFANFSASADEVTSDVSVSPIIVEGRHQGCQAAFEVIRNDPVYFLNEPVFISGSTSLYLGTPETSGVLLKLGVAAIRPDPKFEAPTSAYFLIDQYTTNADDLAAQEAAETVGHQLFMFPFSDLTAAFIGNSLAEGRLNIAYAMANGKMGSEFSVDLGKFPDEMNDWRDCVKTLIDNIAWEDEP
jgi:hypothetical protein